MFLKYEHKDHVHNVEIEHEDDEYFVTYDDTTYTVTAEEISPGNLKIKLADRVITAVVSEVNEGKHVFIEGNVYDVKPIELSGVKKKEKPKGDLKSPISGTVVKVEVEEGDKVEAGDVLMVIEAMKMEYLVKSPHDGEVDEINFEEGDQIDIGELTMHVDKEAE